MFVYINYIFIYFIIYINIMNNINKMNKMIFIICIKNLIMIKLNKNLLKILLIVKTIMYKKT